MLDLPRPLHVRLPQGSVHRVLEIRGDKVLLAVDGLRWFAARCLERVGPRGGAKGPLEPYLARLRLRELQRSPLPPEVVADRAREQLHRPLTVRRAGPIVNGGRAEGRP